VMCPQPVAPASFSGQTGVAQVTGWPIVFQVRRGQMGSAVASHSAASAWIGQPATSAGIVAALHRL
jgi:hypothetical protein